VVDRDFPVLSTLEAELEDVETRIFAEGSQREKIETLYTLKQKLMVLNHAVGPLLESTGKLLGGRVPHVCAGMQEYFRDVYDHLFRISQRIDSLRDMSTTAMSVNLSLLQIAENEVTKRLASYAALIAVPTMIAGIYGMNFEHMPELRSPFGYPIVLALMALADAYLFYRFRKARWL
jgi:magnesium transporter